MSIERSSHKFTPLSIAEYVGNARLGELIVDVSNPVTPLLYIGSANGNVVPAGGGGGGTVPGGASGTLQFNNGGAFGGASGITTDGTNLTVAGIITATGGIVGNIGNASSDIVANTITANLGNIVAINSDTVTANTVIGNIGNITTINSNVVNANTANIVDIISNTVTSNIGNITTINSDTITANGNITGGNLITGGSVYANSGNVYANVVDANTVTADTGTFGNITVTGTTTTSNISGGTTGVNIIAGGTNQNVVLDPSGTGYISASGATLSNVAAPVNPNDATTKAYVDAVAQGLNTHQAADVATTAPLTGTYNNGTVGVGATLTLGAPLTTLDGYTLVVGDRILVKNQADAKQNGVYIYSSSTLLTRATDFDNSTANQVVPGDLLFVSRGSTQAGSSWVQNAIGTGTNDAIIIGTDNITFAQFGAAGSYSAGTGLTLVGSVFNVANTTVTANAYGNGDVIATFTVNQQGQLTAAANVVNAPNAANLTGTTLASGVITSSLTTVGTLGNLNVTNSIVANNITANSNVTANGLVANTANIGSTVITASAANVAGDLNVTGNISGNFTGIVYAPGANTQVLFNDAGLIGADTGITFDKTTDVLTTTGGVSTANLTVSGTSNLNAVSNITITGGSSGQFLQTDGSGVLSWANASVTVPGNDTEVFFNNAGNLGTDSVFTFNSATDRLTVTGTVDFRNTNPTSAPAPAMLVNNAGESATLIASAATGTINVDAQNGIVLTTVNASGNWTVNLRYNALSSFGTVLFYDSVNLIGGSITVVHMVQQGSPAYYPTAFQVDGIAVTPRWQGGTAPTSGNTNGIDVYSYTIIKTSATPTYTVLASQSRFA